MCMETFRSEGALTAEATVRDIQRCCQKLWHGNRLVLCWVLSTLNEMSLRRSSAPFKRQKKRAYCEVTPNVTVERGGAGVQTDLNGETQTGTTPAISGCKLAGVTISRTEQSVSDLV